MPSNSGLTVLALQTASASANLEFTCAPAVFALSVLEVVEAASIAGVAKCSDASLYIIEIHFGPPFDTNR
jgi:hypothetical protein